MMGAGFISKEKAADTLADLPACRLAPILAIAERPVDQLTMTNEA